MKKKVEGAAAVLAALAALLLAPFGALGLSDDQLCKGVCTGSGASRRCTFKFMLDVHASETGYFRVQGCDGVQPTLGVEAGVPYTFDQTDITNWFHPLGFAYGPDGVYFGNQELEKSSVPPGGAPCSATDALLPVCQHPQYMLNGEPLCSRESPSDPCDPEDFGLDEYEGVFFSGKRGDWVDAGNFTVELLITDNSTTELFYFCHIHNEMSGRIKVLESGAQRDPRDITPIPYEYHTIDAFDAMCGTHNASAFEDVGKECPDMTFLCAEDLDDFGRCMAAIDCAMHVEMRVSGKSDPTVTFMHQMIAHHRNAVNMAKILLKLDPPSLRCGTSYDGRRRLDEGTDRHTFCNGELLDEGGEPVVNILWEIINTQNQQITHMRSWLRDNSQPAFDFCEHDAPFPAALVGLGVGAVLVSAIGMGGVYYYMRSKAAAAARGGASVATAKAAEL